MLTPAFAFLFLLLTPPVFSGELSNRLYERVESAYMCFRRFNATHEFGCASPSSGSSGVLERVVTLDALKSLLGKQHLTQIVLVMPDRMLKSDTFEVLRSAREGIVAGIIATLNATEPFPDDLSFDTSCPNNRASFGNQTCNSKRPWNPPGSGLIFEDVKYPLFLVTNITEISRIYDCMNTYNPNSWPKCSAKLDAFMQGAGNSELCLKRRYSELTSVLRGLTASGGLDTCGPMIGANLLVSTAEPTIYNQRQNKSVILFITRGDALSMISQRTPSASYVASTFTVISTSTYILSKFSPIPTWNSTMEVVFVVFDGESQDYIGSSTLAQALFNGIWLGGRALTPAHIYGIIELGELGKLSGGSLPKVFFHLGPKTDLNSEFVKLFNDALIKSGVIVDKPSFTPLPPCSLHAFARRDLQVPSLLVTDYGDSRFMTNYYHSHRDTIDTINRAEFEKGVEPLGIGFAFALCEHLRKGVSPPPTEICQSISKASTSGRVPQFIADVFTCFAGNCSDVIARNASDVMNYLPIGQNGQLTAGFNAAQMPSGFDYYTLSSQIVQWPPAYNNSRTPVAFVGVILHGTIGRNIPGQSNMTSEECRNAFKSQYGSMAGTVVYKQADLSCTFSSTWLQSAISPLFAKLDTDPVPSREDMLNSQESTWTESYWPNSAGQLTIFLMADPRAEVALVVIGCFSVVACLIIALLVCRLKKLAVSFSVENHVASDASTHNEF